MSVATVVRQPQNRNSGAVLCDFASVWNQSEISSGTASFQGNGIPCAVWMISSAFWSLTVWVGEVNFIFFDAGVELAICVHKQACWGCIAIKWPPISILCASHLTVLSNTLCLRESFCHWHINTPAKSVQQTWKWLVTRIGEVLKYNYCVWPQSFKLNVMCACFLKRSGITTKNRSHAHELALPL